MCKNTQKDTNGHTHIRKYMQQTPIPHELRYRNQSTTISSVTIAEQQHKQKQQHKQQKQQQIQQQNVKIIVYGKDLGIVR